MDAQKILEDILKNKHKITISLSLALSLIEFGAKMIQTLTEKGLTDDELKQLIEKYRQSRDKAIDDMDEAIQEQKKNN